MSRGTRSKVASAAKSNDDINTEDDYDNVEDKSSTSHPFISRKSPSDLTLTVGSTIQGSTILHHEFGLLYPIPQSLQSPQIVAYQHGLSLMNNRIFTNVSDLSQWYDEFMA